MADEPIEIVDDNDVVVRTMLRSEANRLNLLHFRAVYVWVVNSKDQLYVPIRKRTKKLYPGGYDFSVSGQVAIGESYEDAMHRETREELNLNDNQYTWRKIAKLTPQKNGVACFITLFEIVTDAKPQFNPDDIESAAWLTPKQILQNIYSGQYFKPDIPMTLRMFYDYTK